MRPRVFFIERPRPNISMSKARDFGDTVIVFDTNDRRCSIFDAEGFGRALLERLEEAQFAPAQDHVCIAGSMVTVAVGIAAIVAKYSRVSLLLYNANQDEYVPRFVGKGVWK